MPSPGVSGGPAGEGLRTSAALRTTTRDHARAVSLELGVPKTPEQAGALINNLRLIGRACGCRSGPLVDQ